MTAQLDTPLIGKTIARTGTPQKDIRIALTGRSVNEHDAAKTFNLCIFSFIDESYNPNESASDVAEE